MIIPQEKAVGFFNTNTKNYISRTLMLQFKSSSKTVNTVLKKTVLKKTVFRTALAVHSPCPFNLLCRFMPTMECSGEHNYLEEHLKTSKKECICSQILATLASMRRGNVGIYRASSTTNVRFILSYFKLCNCYSQVHWRKNVCIQLQKFNVFFFLASEG